MTDDLLEHFIVEARELVQQATDDLLALERDPASAVHLDSAFRAIHTLKGSVGLFDFAPMGHALHAAEDLLSALKGRQARLDGDAIDILLQCIGQTDRWVGFIEESGQLPPEAVEEGQCLAGGLRSQLGQESEAPAPMVPVADIGWVDALQATIDAKARDASLIAVRYSPRVDCFFAGDDPLALLRSVPDLVALRVVGRDPWPPPAEIDPFACNLLIEAISAAPFDAVKAVFRFVPDQVAIHDLSAHGTREPDRAGAEGPTGHDPLASDGSGARVIRIDATRIDRLADLVGEMVVAKNVLAHLVSLGDGLDRAALVQGIQTSHAAIDRLVGDMHRAVMDVRMMPMRKVFRRFPRAVREIAAQLGKTVDFFVDGHDVEADKSVVEGLSEPLVHVLRNAVAHGAEPDAMRLATGKPAKARIDLRARREADWVVVEVSDDGSGIDPATIRRTALGRGVVSGDQLARMSDAEVTDLIFAPGFSTAEKVTDLSGRGVGMDAVRTAVKRLGGQISVHSVPGRGTTIRFALPLTVVMTKAMLIRVGGETYGIPMDDILETTFVPASRILPIQESEAFVLRDRTLPLVRLADLLDIPSQVVPGTGTKVVVMRVEGEKVGLAVDGFAERMDVLMRPMTGLLAGMPGLMGTTLLGDGGVLMILDVPGLIG
ncbi:chemotaxis protein CheA [Microvirga lotononidis]|uniref:Chemotaxis protein CheA n=1 Tax=Microvirga lotononidis TaxID=864069 RepID=I4YYB7_9HYPH|nr:chemotaxis protein CheW [Microvirga lotononidis]EIM28959.1 chemotaxis protein histidine kinase-like protein [Microvirga lotononidis]WQO26877.1 chemotaxis protein CheA [Microvirga lotononidis]